MKGRLRCILGFGEAFDDRIEFEDRPRPAMGDEQRPRIGARRAAVDGVEVEAGSDIDTHLRVAVELRDRRRPIEIFEPMGAQPLHVIAVGTVRPAGVFRLFKEAKCPDA